MECRICARQLHKVCKASAQSVQDVCTTCATALHISKGLSYCGSSDFRRVFFPYLELSGLKLKALQTTKEKPEVGLPAFSYL